MVVTKHSRLTLYPLRISKDKKSFIVEDTLSGEFYEMPAICIDAISMLNEGQKLYQIEGVLKDKYPTENVDIESFIEDLLELRLVESLDGEIIPKKTKMKQKNNGLSWISPRIGRFFFNRYASILYVFAILASIVLLIRKPELFPVYNDVFLL